MPFIKAWITQGQYDKLVQMCGSELNVATFVRDNIDVLTAVEHGHDFEGADEPCRIFDNDCHLLSAFP